ncbi:unnamed protein product, partial [Meganyctiphanes norvegica]
MAWMCCLLMVALTATAATFVSGMCPQECQCPLDSRGRRQVICLKGGLQDPLPVSEIPTETEVLVVESPPGHPNSLTLGPIFKGHPRLEEITVHGSGVPALGAHSFWGLRRLTLLNISHNEISALTDTNFRGADNLKVLDLSHNFVESIPSAAFRHIRRVQYLSLAHNHLPELVPRVFFGLAKLETLDLSGNPLGELPAERFVDVPNLKELHCHECGLTSMSDELLKAMPEIRVLNLRHNRLTEVPPVVYTQHLAMLYLDYNHISVIMPGALTGPPLETLSMSHNRLTALQPGALTNTSLTLLNFGYNRLAKLRNNAVGEAFHIMRHLELSGNPLRIDHLKEVIPKARQLRHLGLGELGITKLPEDMLRHARHLRSLNVSSNYLSSFPSAALYSTPHLNNLDLSHNSFRGLTRDVVTAFASMSSLEYISLGNNPWLCQECHIAALLEWLTDPASIPRYVEACEINPENSDCLRCAGPAQYSGSYLPLLSKDELPKCGISKATWPTWLTSTQQGDDPGKQNINNLQEQYSSILEEEDDQPINKFFKEHLALIVGVGCGLVLALLVVVVAALILARRHSALYFTSEQVHDPDSSQKLMGRNNNDQSPPMRPQSVKPRQPMSVTYTREGPVISTIEEVESIAEDDKQDAPESYHGELKCAVLIFTLAATPVP